MRTRSTPDLNNSPQGHVLLISGDLSGARRLAAGLRRKRFEVRVVGSGTEAMRALSEDAFETVLLDLELHDADGLTLCERIRSSQPELPVVAVARTGTLESAVGSIRAGAYDYLARPLRIDVVALTIRRSVQHCTLRRELRRLRQAVHHAYHFDDLIGSSPPMRDLYELLGQLSTSEISVLIAGETGTGKELAARAIHRASARRSGPFVALNCAAVPDALLESELFGHVRGAFTDALSTRRGLFVQASGGTLFLDEIGELPLGLQPKLLRALQDRVVRPVGSDREVPFDARVISASNVDLDRAVAERHFRSDLYFRLNVVQVDLPPLRSRGSDVLLLAQHFAELAARRCRREVPTLSTSVAKRLMDYPWPGNVRELENCMERAVALCRKDELTLGDLTPRIRDFLPAATLVMDATPGDLEPMHVVERRYILRVLASVGNNKALAARILGFDRKTLYRKLARYGTTQAQGEQT